MTLKNKILVCLLLPLVVLGAKPVIAEPLEIPKPKTQDEYINEIFGDKARIAKAVLQHESQFKLDAKNYNCIYNGKSTFCKKEDRDKAVSVDCGIAQVNIKGKVCPPELMTLDGNMKAVAKIYQRQGLKAWASYNNGKYKKYLN